MEEVSAVYFHWSTHHPARSVSPVSQSKILDLTMMKLKLDESIAEFHSDVSSPSQELIYCMPFESQAYL